MNPRILLYTPDTAKQAAISKLCSRLSFEICLLGPEDFHTNVGYLAGLPIQAASASPIPPLSTLPELMVLCGISQNDLDTFLDIYNQSGISPIPLKAMLTTHNIGWSLYELACHLQAEHQKMFAGN